MIIVSKRKGRLKDARPMSPEKREAILKYVSECVPPKHQLATERALLGMVTRAGAIKVACLQCCNYDRDEVVNCGVIKCALHPVRPYQGKEVTDGSET